jgi:starch phosphorylase
MSGTQFSVEIQPIIPRALARLEELANDLVYSWSRQVRTLFAYLDPDLWHTCGHNPKVFLRRVPQHKLDEAARNLAYLQDYHGVLSDYDTYRAKEVNPKIIHLLDPARDLIAYFCAEFGLHESLPLYSGGLGILAGDYCKAASDLGLPFVAVGLLYRAGYFDQTIDGRGNQQLRLGPLEFSDLPISAVLDAEGRHLTVAVDLPGRRVDISVWQAVLGHIRLFLLDTDSETNHPPDRQITYQLYGGDHNRRIQQEIVLGIGGVRALRAMGLMPTIWHINEGHAAFMVLERCRELVESGLDFCAVLERIAAATVFTTHTPVPAGHDIFTREMMLHYFHGFIHQLGISEETFLQLGATPSHTGGFNQTALALRGSRFHNGVSQIHGEVAARMEAYVWPEVPPSETPLDYITNGIHVPTFLAAAWVNLFDLRWGVQWRNEFLNRTFWERIDDLPDSAFWSVHQLLRFDLLREIKVRATAQFRRNGYSPSLIKRLTRYLGTDGDMLVLGFARRFATYKRATLLFTDPERLARLLSDPNRPVLVIFSGKAHPHDLPGQELIRAVYRFSLRPEFEGKILVLEGYDLALARKLVTGVDIWLNTPQYPLEACGTSGMKAGVNGVINLSVLDGWWAEGYDGENGWAITPHAEAMPAENYVHLEAQELLNILEYEAIPLYYERNRQGYSPAWIKKAKASMKSLIPRYNTERMVMDYVRRFYSPAIRQQALLSAHDSLAAIELAHWKKRIAHGWPEVRLHLIAGPRARVKAGESLKFIVAVRLGRLTPEDVVMECIVGSGTEPGRFAIKETHPFVPKGRNAEDETLFELEFTPSRFGLQDYKLRLYPYHPLLTHRFETGLMIWI